MPGVRQVLVVAEAELAGLLATRVKAATLAELPDLLLEAACNPPGCSTGRLATKTNCVGFPSPGTSPRIGTDARLTSGDTLYWLLTESSYMLVLVLIGAVRGWSAKELVTAPLAISVESRYRSS